MSMEEAHDSAEGMDQDTFYDRIDKYNRNDRLILMIAGALLAEIATIATGALDDSPPIFKQIAYTLIFASGFFLAASRSKYDKHASRLRRHVEKYPSMRHARIPSRTRRPVAAQPFYCFGLFLSFAAGLCILAGVWCLDR